MSSSEEINKSDDPYARILELLNSEDQSAINEGYELLVRELHGYARARLKTRRDQVNFQPESVVASVVKDLLKRGAVFDNARHIEGRTKREVFRKIQTRGRAKGNQNRQQPKEGPLEAVKAEFDDADPAGLIDDDRQGRLDVSRLIGSAVDPVNHSILDRIRRGLDSTQIGKEVGLLPATVNQRWKRMKQPIREALLKPIQMEVSDDEWEIIERLLIRGEKPWDLQTSRGMTARDLVDEYSRIIDDIVKPALGDEGATVLAVLLGKRPS